MKKANGFGLLVACASALAVNLSACDSGVKSTSQEELRAYFAKHRVGRSRDYAVMKNGTDYLLTVHGYLDDYKACMEMIAPYNKDPKLSEFPGTYNCVPLN